MPAQASDPRGNGAELLRVNLLGPFSISLGSRTTGRWERPPAKRLCQLLLVSPGRRLSREAAREALFPDLAPEAASAALSKALSNGRAALRELGPRGSAILRGNRSHVWADLGSPAEVDVDVHERQLRAALEVAPGPERDDLLTLALAEEGILLEDEPYASWAVRPREHLDWARQDARLVLARDRAQGTGRATPKSVVSAWESCLAHDPTCEEAASALMRLYRSQRRHALVESTYKRCRTALEELGLRTSPALEEVHGSTAVASPFEQPAPRAAPQYPEDRRLVSVLFAELSGPPGGGQRMGPEEVRELVGGALAQVVADVEAFGGMVTSVSGAGLVALFGAPEAHEDDPERALRAAFRAVTAAGWSASGLTLRAGVETGPAVVGPIGAYAMAQYGAVGEVVRAAAAFQSLARPTSVLVGPATHAATEGLFEWGPLEEVVISPGAKPLKARYLEQPKARPAGQAGRRRLAGAAPLVGRTAELSLLHETLREVTSGQGSVLVIAGEPGLGKTRLVHEFRKLFMGWVGTGSGRLPLWIEGRAASYRSSQPYGVYQQLLSGWVGAAPEHGDEMARQALERAVKAAFGARADQDQVDMLAQVMGIGTGRPATGVPQPSPEQLQKARFAAVLALLSHLVAHGPTLVVLEDLHWADPTSLRLTKELSSLTTHGQLVLVLTRRPEPDPGFSALEAALAEAPGLRLRKVELTALASNAERDLARALLGPATADDVVATVSQRAEGNPLFLEEQLASMLETGALVRTERGGWRLDRAAQGELPEAIERLVRSRVDRLGPAPRHAIVAGSVLGPEFSLAALASVTDLGGGLVPAVSELCAAGLLVELRKVPEPAYRFRHALIQESTYQGLLRGQRQSLHSRAAWGLEEASAGRLEEVAGLLGHHFAMAGETERAVHYLELAGDRAVAAFANDEARSSYRRGLALLGAEPGHAEQAVGICLKLGRLAWRVGNFSESRAAYEEAVKLASSGTVVMAARALQLLGTLETADHRHDAAFAALDAAEARLQSCADKGTDEWAEVWIDVQLARASLHYWRNEPEAGMTVLELVRPVVEARAKPRSKIDFYSQVSGQRARATRYMVDESVLRDYRAAWAAVLDAGLENEMFWVAFHLGFGLLWYRDFAGAQAELEWTLNIASRADDKTLALRCLVYLCLAHLCQHDVGTVKKLAPQAEALAQALGFPEYKGMAKAMQAWVAWKEGRYADVEALGEEALGQWRTCVVHYSWYWAGLWPLIAVRLGAGRVEEAVAAARELLGSDQQRLVEELESEVQGALDAWDQGDANVAGEVLAQALGLADRLGYA